MIFALLRFDRRRLLELLFLYRYIEAQENERAAEIIVPTFEDEEQALQKLIDDHQENPDDPELEIDLLLFQQDLEKSKFEVLMTVRKGSLRKAGVK